MAKTEDHDHHHHGEGSELPDIALRVKTLESLLIEKGYVDPDALDALIDVYENKIGPRNGAAVVARAWSDERFKTQLLENATEAIASMGFTGRQGEHMVAVENTPDLHNMVVCTLMLLLPLAGARPAAGVVQVTALPVRAVADPRGVLEEFGVEMPDETAVRVWDSTAEIRYMVIPMRPEGTDGWSEERLSELVTRDSMIGTGLALTPEQLDKAASA